MAVDRLVGFEVGDLSEFNTTSGTVASSTAQVKHGAYSLRVGSTSATAYGTIYLRDTGQATVAMRFWLRVATAPAANSEEILSIGDNSGSFGSEEFSLRINSSRQLEVYNIAFSLLATGSTALSLDTWYSIGVKVTNGDAGAYEIWIGNTQELSGTGDFRDNAIGTTTFKRILVGKVNRNTQTTDCYYDSFVIDTANIPDHNVALIVRSPATGGTPNADTWTKSSGTDAGALWDETPFNATNNCVSPSSGDPLAQTADVAVFSSTQSGHGSETIASGDTIVACQIFSVSKRSSGSGRTHEHRIRLNTTNNDQSIYTGTAVGAGLTTSDSGCFSPAITATYAEINAAEIGGEKSGGASGQSFTIEDAWLYVAYVVATSAADWLPKRTSSSITANLRR